MGPILDLQAIRKRFPALDKDQAYFDNAGGSQVLQEVIDAISTYLSTSNVQLGASYPVGKTSSTAYEAGYEAAAAFIGAYRPWIVLGPSTTQLLRNLSQALYMHIPPGSEIILSNLDHEANLAPWLALAALCKAKVTWWRPNGDDLASRTNPRLTPESLRPLINKNTRIVAVTHVSNVLGTIHDIRGIATEVHRWRSALLCVDGVAYAPHRVVEVLKWGVDFYCFSWYKVYGPHIALLYASPSAIQEVGNLGHYFKADDSLEDKLGLAGASYELVAGIPPVVRYLASPLTDDGRKLVADAAETEIGRENLTESLIETFDRIADHEEVLQRILLEYLHSEPHGRHITIWGEPVADKSKRVPVISFSIDGWQSKDLVLAVQAKSSDKFGFRWGSFYSNRLIADVLGLKDTSDGVIRVSLVHYNTEEEVRAFVDVLDAVLSTQQVGGSAVPLDPSQLKSST